MLTKSTAEAVLAEALSTGGDFAEIFMEDTVYGTISMIDGNYGGQFTRSWRGHPHLSGTECCIRAYQRYLARRAACLRAQGRGRKNGDEAPGAAYALHPD